MSVWNPENIKDVAESIGIPTLSDEASRALTSDLEYRLSQVLEEALKFMRHGKRTTLTTQDISQALRALDVEPLYGYESTRPLRFGEASIGPGQPLYYVEDEEMEFEKLINAPLPKVPREITFTAHWLAVEGVQPSIPQNPTTAESRNQELAPKGANVNPNLAAMSGGDNVTVKPLVKHVLSKELQQYFEKVCGALLDDGNNDYRVAALASVGSDPGLHQLVPYFVQFIAEKVTHSTRDISVLTQMMELTHSMLSNKSLFLDPYIASLVPPILTCLVGRNLGTPNDPLSSYSLRQTAASLLRLIAKRYSKTSHMLKPRLARTCLKYFLDPTKPLGSQYGGMIGLQAVGGVEVTRALIVPNLREYEGLLRDAIEGNDDGKRKEAEMIVSALLDTLLSLEGEIVGTANGMANGHAMEMKVGLEDKIGPLFAEKVMTLGRPKVVKAIMQCE
ncbi:uncharacterized protein KY384_005226 [Bacidia gigantensis]|uniref:uncharacterized protein n=1 Tax=Bacidia gigantensis TaxID=2732470 RepID=UPI001D03CAB7|nr:uncharacterized protein KY384_005226 [Bacidia gigantensis]KAG8529745.1 hypothetical protein KY384_005226 [Bacidia gigantensis]